MSEQATQFAGWSEKVTADAGVDDISALSSYSPSGERVELLYNESVAAVAPLEVPGTRLALALAYKHWNPEVVAEHIVTELGGVEGATAWVRLDRASRIGASHRGEDGAHVGRGGCVFADRDAVDRFVAATPDSVKLVFDPGCNTLPLVGMCSAHRGERVDVSFDPVATWATDGILPASINDVFAEARRCQPLVSISTQPYHEAGCGVADEVAFAIATAIEYLDELGADAAGAFHFRVTVTPDIFVEVAKFRALRRLWARVCAAMDVEPSASIHAVVSTRSFSLTEPWTNGLRATTGAFAAALAGVDSIGTVSHDWVAASPIGRRLARNIPLILDLESHLAVCGDPTAGSAMVEEMTKSIEERAWAAVHGIEAQGGMIASLASGAVRERVDSSWEQLSARYRDGGVLVGVNEFRGSGEELEVATPDIPVDEIADWFPELTDELEDAEYRGLEDVIAAAAEGVCFDDLSFGLRRGQAAAIQPLAYRRIAAELGWEGGPR